VHCDLATAYSVLITTAMAAAISDTGRRAASVGAPPTTGYVTGAPAASSQGLCVKPEAAWGCSTSWLPLHSPDCAVFWIVTGKAVMAKCCVPLICECS
jgi:hypothetical protein